MSYIKTTWITGDIVTAPRMNNMESGIYNNDAAVTELQSEVTDTQSDVSTLQTNVSILQSNVSTLQTNVTNLQTVTGNLVPSIADIFSTSSTYAVGDHVMYNGRLYECKTAVTSAGAWNASAWEAVSVFKYDDVVGVIKITNASTTMATVETTLAEINTANDHIVFDVSALSAGMHLCTIYLSDGKYRITDLATGFDGEGLYSGTDTLVSILQKGSAPFYNVSTEPYTFRAINDGVGDKESLDKLVGGSLGWNQLVTTLTGGSASGITVTANASSGSITASGTATASGNVAITDRLTILADHKYLLKGSKGAGKLGMAGGPQNDNGNGAFLAFSTTATRQIFYVFSSGQTLSETLYPQLFDLTAMFGSTIADYVYSLGTTNGVAWLRKYIDIDSYHTYDAGSIQSVQATAHVTTGFNQWDGTYTSGQFISAVNGTATGSNASYGYTDYISVIGGQGYYFNMYSIGSSAYGAAWYDDNKAFISGVAFTQGATAKVGVITAPLGAMYMRTSVKISDIGTTCINISKTSGTPKNGDYVPYNGHSYPLGSDTLRGVPQLVSNKLQFDGDVKTADGTINRKYGIVDLGTLNWTYNGRNTADTANIFYVGFSSAKAVANIICGSKFVPRAVVTGTWENVGLNEIEIDYYKYIVAGSSESTAAAVKTAMSGIYLVYELATSTTESSTAYQRVQEAPQGGTEAFTTESIVPVGHYTRNPGNILAAIELAGSEEENPVYSLDSTLYTARKVENAGIIGKESLNKLIGGSLGWNQLATNFVNRSQTLGISITADNVNGKITTSGTASATNNLYFMQGLSVITGHKYLLIGSKGKGTLVIPSFTDRVDSGNGMIFSSGSTSTAAQIAYGFTSGQTYSETLYPQFTDLTQAFGSTIADYVYGLEQATAGAGVAWLRKYIDIDSYHAYDSGSIQSVQATAHVTTSGNLIDTGLAPQSAAGGINISQNTDGSVTIKGTAQGTTGYILYQDMYALNLKPNIPYHMKIFRAVDGVQLQVYVNNVFQAFTTGADVAFTIPNGATSSYVRVRIAAGATINATIYPVVSTAELSKYEVPVKHTYPLGSDTLRGIPQLVSNKLSYDGDEKYPDGTIRRKYGIVDLGTLNWSYSASDLRFVTTGLSLAKAISNVDEVAKMICARYSTSTYRYVDGRYQTDKIIGLYGTGSTNYLAIKDTAYTDATVLKNSLSGVYLVYPLATETTESSTAYKYMQTISADGIESFTTSSPVPVGHETAIPENTLGAIALVAGD